MNPIFGNDFTSFTAASIINLGTQPCLIGTTLPAITGITLTEVDTSSTGYPAINNQIVNGNILTLYGTGLGQILMGWNSGPQSGVGNHASLYVRNKGGSSTDNWSDWYEIIDSGNFAKYTTSQSGEGASGTWGINISGNSNTTNFLLPESLTGTYDRYSTLTLDPGEIMVWGESFGDTSLKYTSDGVQYDYTDTGNVGFWLTPSPNSDNLRLNMIIDGTYYGSFSGNLQGNATTATRANINTVTNTLAYYDNTLGHFNYTNYIKYLKHVPVGGEAQGYQDGLEISGISYYQKADLLDHTNGQIQFGDSGPQIHFRSESTTTPVRGAIIFNEYTETAGAWPSFHFVTENSYATIKSAGVVAHTHLTVGSPKINESYSLYINGISAFTNIAHFTSGATVHFLRDNQQLVWYNANDTLETNTDTGLSWNGIGTYAKDTGKSYLNISNKEGINLTTMDMATLYHNANVIPAIPNGASAIGNATTPVYIVDGVFVATTYSLNATINSGTANRIAYYSDDNTIAAAAHYINNEKIGINLTDEPSYCLEVNGTVGIRNNVTIGDTGDKSILFKGTKATTPMIQFLDNESNADGNGLKIGGGGVVVVGSGESATNLSVAAPDEETLYLLSDGVLNIEAGGQTIANRIGFQVTTGGHIIPVKAEANNSNKQTLGTSDSKWAAVYIGSNDTYGSNTEPIYWNNGIPTALTYTANRLYYSESALSYAAGTHYANSTKIAINSTTEPTETLYVNGAAKINGNTTIIGNVIPSKTNTYSLGGGGETPYRWKSLFIGSADSHGSGEQPIYWSNGVPTSTTYGLKATVNNGTASRIAYYSGERLLTSSSITSDGSYLGSVSYLSINHAHQTSYRLYVDGGTYVNGDITFAPTGTTGTAGKLKWSGSTDSASIYYHVGSSDRGRLYINTGDDADCLVTLAYGDTEKAYFNNSTPSFFPATTNSGSLGLGGTSPQRWGHVYVGTADSYGDAYTPVYWNSGVPAAVTMVQQADFTIASGETSVTITKTNVYTANTMVLTIVVTSGEANLNGPINWTSGNNTVVLSTTKTSGAVSGYILTARGAKI